MPCDITAANSVHTYDADPQPAAGIDSWNGGLIIPRKLLVLVSVKTVTAGGTLTVSLYDSASAITTGNGGSATHVASLTAITEAGLYFAEIDLNHIFTEADEDSNYVARYHSIKAAAATQNSTGVSVALVYCFLDRKKPEQDATELTVTYNEDLA